MQVTGVQDAETTEQAVQWSKRCDYLQRNYTHEVRWSTRCRVTTTASVAPPFPVAVDARLGPCPVAGPAPAGLRAVKVGQGTLSREQDGLFCETC